MDLEFDAQHLWHPYTSTSKPLPCYPVIAAHDVYLTLEDGRDVIDGMASWWSAVHGYNVPELNNAIVEQSQQMSHVMFGGITHAPAINLGKKLVALTPEPLQKVFIADSGSIAVEVALKMAIQYWDGRNKPNKTRMVTVNHGYHGDTFGAMSVCDPVNGMHSLFESALPKSLFLGAIPMGFDTPIDLDLLANFEQQIAEQHEHLAAFIIEPVVQGAGGMRIYNPAWLVEFRRICDKYKLLLIFDEIATGFGRTGKMFALEHANVVPDILCLGKAISGGYMTLAATLATDEVADGVSNSKAGVFMHGPTFMGNPLACSVANASIELLMSTPWGQRIRSIQQQLEAQLSPLAKFEHVSEVRVLGAIGIVEMTAPIDTAAAQKIFIENGVWIRPFGKLLYIMPAYIMTATQLSILTAAIASYVESVA